MIPEEILAYCENHSTPEPEVLRQLTRETHLTQVYPRMLTGHLQGTFLRMFSQVIGPARILEIGAFTGYSAICLAQGLAKGGILHTIEVNPELEQIITRYTGMARLKEKVVLHIGDAVRVIPSLDESWDLVYIDADKPSYLDYYKMVLPSVRPGGWILADNTLWDGRVIEEKREGDKDTQGIVAFNEYVAKDESVEKLLLPVRDGLMMIRKR